MLVDRCCWAERWELSSETLSSIWLRNEYEYVAVYHLPTALLVLMVVVLLFYRCNGDDTPAAREYVSTAV